MALLIQGFFIIPAKMKEPPRLPHGAARARQLETLSNDHHLRAGH